MASVVKKLNKAKRVSNHSVGILIILLFFAFLGIIIIPFILPHYVTPNISDITVDSLIIIITLYLVYECICIWRFNFGNRDFVINKSEIILPSLRLNPSSGNIAYYTKKDSIIKIDEIKNIHLANEEHTKHVEILEALNIPGLIDNVEGIVFETKDGSYYGIRNFPNLEYDLKAKLDVFLKTLEKNNHPLFNQIRVAIPVVIP